MTISGHWNRCVFRQGENCPEEEGGRRGEVRLRRREKDEKWIAGDEKLERNRKRSMVLSQEHNRGD